MRLARLILVAVVVFCLMCLGTTGKGGKNSNSTQTTDLNGGDLSLLTKKIGYVLVIRDDKCEDKDLREICRYFAAKRMECEYTDKNAGSDEDKIKAVNEKLDDTGAKYHASGKPVILWGQYRAGLIALIVAAERDDVDAVAVLDPTLKYDLDKNKYTLFAKLKTNLAYIYSDEGVTDEKTAKLLAMTVDLIGKKAGYTMINYTKTDEVCGSRRAIEKQYTILKDVFRG